MLGSVIIPDGFDLTAPVLDEPAGRLVDEAEVDAWIDSIGTDHELPVPYAGR
jgi:hypothetical protein